MYAPYAVLFNAVTLTVPLVKSMTPLNFWYVAVFFSDLDMAYKPVAKEYASTLISAEPLIVVVPFCACTPYAEPRVRGRPSTSSDT